MIKEWRGPGDDECLEDITKNARMEGQGDECHEMHNKYTKKINPEVERTLLLKYQLLYYIS